jgi:hypothetical protein
VAEVDLIVQPSSVGERVVTADFLMYRNGEWQEPEQGSKGAPFDLSEIQNGAHAKFRSVMRSLRRRRTNPFPALRYHGEKLYKQTVHEEVRRMLEDATVGGGDAPVLRLYLHKNLEGIPWEMMHDDTDFLGLRFQIARLPIVASSRGVSDDQLHTVGGIHSLLGKGVVDPGSPEFEAWKGTFGELQVHQLPSGDGNDDADWPDVDCLYEEGDILHITCHGKRNGKGPYWTLDPDGYPDDVDISVEAIDFRTIRKKLVFGNACASATGAVDNGQEDHGTLIPGLGITFFECGARAVVGTLSPITKELAVDFGRRFYERLLANDGQPSSPIGKVLWETKRHYNREQNDPNAKRFKNDPSWLFYCLYGPPEMRFQLSIN